MRKFLQLTLSLLLLFVANSANAWKFTVSSPEEGNVEELYQIVLDEPAGTMWIDEMGAMPCTLKCSDGTEYTYNMGDNFSAQVAGTPLNSAEIVAPGTYTLTIPAGTFHINGVGNDAQTFTWTIGKSGGDEEKSPYTLTYDKASQLLKFTKEGCTSYDATYEGGATLEGYEGFFSFNPIDPEWTMMGNTCIGAYVALADGDYTLKVQAGTYKFDGVENEAFEIKFTVGEGTQGGGNAGDFDGEKWQEVLFESGVTSVTVPVTFETEGITLTTIGREFMGTTIDVAYNTYDEKEIDWNNGTKLVITAKDNISGIVFDGNFLQFASADKGMYTNGVWSGALMKGETLILTASDGIHIKKITVLYNGDERKEVEEEEKEGEILIGYPEANQLIASISNGGKLATFTMNKEYAQVIIDIDDDDEDFNEIYKFPTRMVDNAGEKSDNLHMGENTITASTPDGKNFYFFKNHTYTMTIRGYVNMWDQSHQYDAIATVKFVGNGVEAETLSDVTLTKVYPTADVTLPEGPRVITVSFSEPVKNIKAVTPQGMAGSINYTCKQVDLDGRKWQVDLGNVKVDSEEGGSSAITVEISGKDMEGNTLNLGKNAARALVLSYTVSKTAEEIQPDDVVEEISFLEDGEETALNAHSEVSVATANAITAKVAASVREASYTIYNMVGEDVLGATVWKVGDAIATGAMAINTTAYAELEETINFEQGSKYQVSIQTTDATGVREITSYTFNGAYVAPIVVVPALLNGEEEITLNDHSAVSVEEASAIKVAFENGAAVKLALYQIEEVVENEEEEGEELAMGQLSLNTVGYAEFENTIQFEQGKQYAVRIMAWDNENITSTPIVTYECLINGAYVAPIVVVPALINGEEEITLNDHSAVSVEAAEALKVTFENGAEIKLAMYSICEAIVEDGELTYGDDIATDVLSLNTIGYAEFDEAIVFEQGKQYWVRVMAWDNENPTSTPVATYECLINGAHVAPVVANIEISEAGWATYYAPFTVDLNYVKSNGIKAYIVSGVEDNMLVLTEVKGGIIPAYQPVLINGTEGVIPMNGEEEEYNEPEGILEGVEEDGLATIGNYVLQNHNGKVGFYQVSEENQPEVKANRATLVVPNDKAKAKAYFFGEATAIKALDAMAAGKAIYDMNGRQIQKLQKGINIVNGVKVLVK